MPTTTKTELGGEGQRLPQDKETFREQLSRVEQMAEDTNGETWDLSENDHAALRAVLQDRQRLAAKCNAQAGSRDPRWQDAEQAAERLAEGSTVLDEAYHFSSLEAAMLDGAVTIRRLIAELAEAEVREAAIRALVEQFEQRADDVMRESRDGGSAAYIAEGERISAAISLCAQQLAALLRRSDVK